MYKHKVIRSLKSGINKIPYANRQYVNELIGQLNQATTYHLGKIPLEGIFFQTFIKEAKHRTTIENEAIDLFEQKQKISRELRLSYQKSTRELADWFPESPLEKPIYLEVIIDAINLFEQFSVDPIPQNSKIRRSTVYCGILIWSDGDDNLIEDNKVINIQVLPMFTMNGDSFRENHDVVLGLYSTKLLLTKQPRAHFDEDLNLQIDVLKMHSPHFDHFVDTLIDRVQKSGGTLVVERTLDFDWTLELHGLTTSNIGLLPLVVELDQQIDDNSEDYLRCMKDICDALDLDSGRIINITCSKMKLIPGLFGDSPQFITVSNGLKVKSQLNSLVTRVQEQFATEIAGVFFKLLNCKNVTTEVVRSNLTTTPKKQPHKTQSKSMKAGSEEYHVIKMVLPKTKIKYVGGKRVATTRDKQETTKISFRSGHFKTFTKEKPLFGKAVGTFWWQPIVKTNKEVVYDVTVNEKKAAEQLSSN